MKTHFALFIGISSLLSIASCSSEQGVNAAGTATEKSPADSFSKAEWFPETNFDTLRGLYTGDFGDGFINVFLTYVNDKKAIGYNVHKGLQRNISGPVVQRADFFELTLNEPGDNPYDGVFVLNISKKNGSITATWNANDPKIPSKKFTLKKQEALASTTYEGGEITPENFMNVFSNASLEDGNVEFSENGIVRFTYYPDGNEHSQQEVIKGSWKFTDKKTMLVEWAKNNRFKERSMKFKLIQSENEEPRLQGPKDLSIYPYYY